jgi:3-oxoacyl-[acyl-carrier-protein] synthase-3
VKAFIRGLSTYVSEQVLTNKDLEDMVDTNDEWIKTRTGIEERRIFDLNDKDLKTSDIATEVAQRLLDKTGIAPEEVDGIILGSMYPDHVFPATACVVQGRLGCVNAFAYDLTAACAFVPFALHNASLMIESGQYKNIMVIGAELSSRVVDWTDRNTCVLFGDGAGALMVSANPDAESNSEFLSSHIQSSGKHASILELNCQGDDPKFIKMEGTTVFKLAVNEMAASVEKCLSQAGLTTEDIDLLIPHQANIRILDATQKKLGLRDDQVIVNVQKYGNTSSATIPLALQDALDQGRLKRGMTVAMVGIGGGMSWGCNLLRW